MRKYVLWLSNLIPILIGVSAAAWTDLSIWVGMKEGLIAFLGFLAASLVQVMPITANFIQSDELTPREARELSAALERQQFYWIGLLAFTIFALIVLIASIVLDQKVSDVPFFELKALQISWRAIITFFLVTNLFFVLLKMIGVFDGVLSLHRLRSKLVIDLAQRRFLEKNKSDLGSKKVMPIDVPDGYGEVVSPTTTII